MAYTGNSIVDYLKSIGKDSSYSARKALAEKYGISNYTGSEQQNSQLLNILKQQKPEEETKEPLTPTEETKETTTPLIEAEDMTWLTGDKDFQSLPEDMKNYLTSYYDIVSTADKEAQEQLTKALDEAKAEADPYWKEIITVAQDEVTRSLGEQQADFDFQEKTLTKNIERIRQDLATKKEDLSIDEQADLAKQLRSYEQSLSSLRENAASGGMTFSSKKVAAEELLNKENQEIVESTKTTYMRNVRDLELAAARGEEDAKAQLEDYRRQLGEGMVSTIRTAESKLGTANLPDISKYAESAKALGDITGTIEEEKTQDILERAKALTSLNNL